MRLLHSTAAICALLASPVVAAENGGGPDQPLGASAAPAAGPAAALGPIAPFAAFRNAQHGTGGVGLRNRLAGGIEVSGAPSPSVAAYLYWAVITNGPAPLVTKRVTVQRRFPLPVSGAVLLNGTVVGTGPQPCWAGNTITVLRASVPTNLANGSGLYEVRFGAGASGNTQGRDPWFGAPQLPLLEGASLVVVGAGNSTVALYDRGLSAQTFTASAGLSYTLNFPVAYAGTAVLWDNIAADGQHGSTRIPLPGLANEITRINAAPVMGPGSVYNDSGWNGAVAGPLPQLWDDTSVNVSPRVPIGATSMAVSVTGGGDCLTPVANVVAVR